VTYRDGASTGDLTAVSTPEDDLLHLRTQHELAAVWADVVPTFPSDRVHVLPSIEHAADFARLLDSSHIDVLVTGSLILVGGMIEAGGLSKVAL